MLKAVFDHEADIKTMCRFVVLIIFAAFVAFVSNLKITIACSSLSQQSMKASADTVAEVFVEVDACSLNEVLL